MSTKKAHLYNMAYTHLADLCVRKVRGVTAGEYAKHMGIARSTAIRWLNDMLAEGAVMFYGEVAKNHQPCKLWQPVGLDDMIYDGAWTYPAGDTHDL